MNNDEINEAERLITDPKTSKIALRLTAHLLLLALRKERERCSSLYSHLAANRRAFESYE